MKILINSKSRRDLAKEMVGNIRGEENMEVIIQPHVEKKSDEQPLALRPSGGRKRTGGRLPHRILGDEIFDVLHG